MTTSDDHHVFAELLEFSFSSWTRGVPGGFHMHKLGTNTEYVDLV